MPSSKSLMRKGPDIEVGTGKPGYRWVQGWIVRNPLTGNDSIPLRYFDALSLARECTPPTVRVTVRRDRETLEPVLFFRNSNARGGSWLECFTPSDGHSECSREYYLQCTPIPPVAPESVRLASLWESIGPVRYRVIICRRLPR